MKISIFYLYASSAAQESARPEPRVYWQLSKMMTSFNPDFSSKKFWLYGCNCVMLGNNQLSDPGYGPPVDALDTACKRHKDCLSFGLKFQIGSILYLLDQIVNEKQSLAMRARNDIIAL